MVTTQGNNNYQVTNIYYNIKSGCQNEAEKIFTANLKV